MRDRFEGGDVIELRRPRAPSVSSATLAAARQPLFEHLQKLGLVDVDRFASAIDESVDLCRHCGQDAVHKAATANLLAALVTLRCGLGFDALAGILEAAVADNERLRRPRQRGET